MLSIKYSKLLFILTLSFVCFEASATQKETLPRSRGHLIPVICRYSQDGSVRKVSQAPTLPTRHRLNESVTKKT